MNPREALLALNSVAGGLAGGNAAVIGEVRRCASRTRRTELSSAQVSVALLQLEMKKLIQQHPGSLFTRAR